MHSSEKIEELVTGLEGYRWDAILLNETWRHEPAELWETQHKHIFMGAGQYDNKHGVGIMLNKRWRKRIIDTEYINERFTGRSFTFWLPLFFCYFMWCCSESEGSVI